MIQVRPWAILLPKSLQGTPAYEQLVRSHQAIEAMTNLTLGGDANELILGAMFDALEELGKFDELARSLDRTE